MENADNRLKLKTNG